MEGNIRTCLNMKYYCDNKRHLVCLPYSVENLHEMAVNLGIKKCWFHKNHYDIPKGMSINCAVVSPKDIVRIINGNYHDDTEI